MAEKTKQKMRENGFTTTHSLSPECFNRFCKAAKSSETESSTCVDNKFSGETTPSECCGETDEMDSKTPRENSCRKNSPTAKMPSQAEIDDFFAATEQEGRKRFMDKYNYDFAKDAPLQGRYEWVRLKP